VVKYFEPFLAHLALILSTAMQTRDQPGVADKADQNSLVRLLKGFTLLELLVVVVILFLLVAILGTAVPAARSSVQRTYCQNNLSQLSRALAAYVSEFHAYPGTPPNPLIPAREAPSAVPDHEAHLWDDRLAPYLGRAQKVMLCPSHVLSRRELAYGAGYRANYNYGYNALGCDRIRRGADGSLLTPTSNYGLGCLVVPNPHEAADVPWTALVVTDSKVRFPTEMIALADRKGGDEWTSPTVVPGTPNLHSDDDPSDQHRGGANAVFCDGHCEYARQDRWKETSDSARCRWNNDHEPHRVAW
jgi:prepilin-type processing-associated H-X9-DG protein/prepilin-type N-terminal cleavage/methylation domain-containing protein